ncbi:MAG: hypothetical protein ABI697_06470 [Devosia sp.]
MTPGLAQLPFDYGHRPSHLEADFIEGDGNRLALGHIRAFPAWPGPLTLIEGPAKSGKSHLARIWSERSGAAFVEPGELANVPGGQFPLVVEDVERAGYDEAAFFHLLNQSMRDGRPLLMTTATAIANWPFATDDLKSRARLAQHFTLALSDDIELSQMFAKLFQDRQVQVDPGVIAYLVPRMERAPEEAVALAELMDHMAMSAGRPISRRIAAAALAQRGVAQLELDLEGDET